MDLCNKGLVRPSEISLLGRLFAHSPLMANREMAAFLQKIDWKPTPLRLIVMEGSLEDVYKVYPIAGPVLRQSFLFFRTVFRGLYLTQPNSSRLQASTCDIMTLIYSIQIAQTISSLHGHSESHRYSYCFHVCSTVSVANREPYDQDAAVPNAQVALSQRPTQKENQTSPGMRTTHVSRA